MYRQSKKNLLNSNTFSTCRDNMVNFGLLTAEICWRVWSTPANFNGFRVLAALLHGTLAVGVSQTAALNRGRHPYSAGRPSHWALAHISSIIYFSVFLSLLLALNHDGRSRDREVTPQGACIDHAVSQVIDAHPSGRIYFD